LDDEARQLVGSILVVIGFLLGAGVITLLSVSSLYSSLYFVGVIVLVISIIFDYKAIRLKFNFYHVETDPAHMLETDPDVALREKTVDPTRVPYLAIVQRNIRNMTDIINNNEDTNRTKARLIAKAWFFLIPGLAMIILFVIVSTLSQTFTP
jgi:hypothetical protein